MDNLICVISNGIIMILIGIIGGLDFLGCDITLRFLADNWQVKVAVFYPEHINSTLIQTSLSGNNNLEICRIDSENSSQLQHFVRDCTVLIHCGIPMKLCEDPEGIPIYVPIIKKTGIIAEIVRKTNSIKKVIFIAAPVMNDFEDHFCNSMNISTPEKKEGDSQMKYYNAKEAWFHANRVIHHIITSFFDTRLEIIFVSPAGIKNNILLNSREITATGLKFLFANKINHDPLFQKIIRLSVINTLVNVNDVPGIIFNLVVPCFP
jgi:dihydroflavonol-4-reductase